MLEVIAITVLVVYIYLGFKQPAIALVTSPFITLLVFVNSVDRSSLALIITPFIFFGTVMVVSISKRESEFERWPQTCAKWILIISIILLLSVTIGALLQSAGAVRSMYFMLCMPISLW